MVDVIYECGGLIQDDLRVSNVSGVRACNNVSLVIGQLTIESAFIPKILARALGGGAFVSVGCLLGCRFLSTLSLVDEELRRRRSRRSEAIGW